MAPKAQNTATTGEKRKRNSNINDRPRKKPMSIHEARKADSQAVHKAFPNGELNVDKFVKAKEFEILALEESMKRSKDYLNTRAFQEVPRDLRRRTASHNVKRVPKRLQERAAREVGLRRPICTCVEGQG